MLSHRCLRGKSALVRLALCATCCATASASVHGLTNSTSVADMEATEIALHVGICLLCIVILMLLRCACLYRAHTRRQTELMAKVDELQRAQNPVHAEAPKAPDEVAAAACAVPISPPTIARISDLGRKRVYQKHTPRHEQPAQRRMTQMFEFMLTVALDVPTAKNVEAAARSELSRGRVNAKQRCAEPDTDFSAQTKVVQKRITDQGVAAGTRTGVDGDESSSDESISDDDNDTKVEDKVSTRMHKLVLTLVPLIFIIAISAVGASIDMNDMLQSMKEYDTGTLCVLYTIIMAIGTVLFVPALVLTLAAGVIFSKLLGKVLGIVLGSVVVFVGASLGSIVAFWLGRYMFKRRMHAFLKTSVTFMAVNRALKAEGTRFMVLMRLSPLIPFNAFNYLSGVLEVTARSYCLGLLGMVPGTVAFVYLGSGMEDVAAGGGEGGNNVVDIIVWVLGSAFGILGMVSVSKAAKRELKKHLEANTDGHDDSGSDSDLQSIGTQKLDTERNRDHEVQSETKNPLGLDPSTLAILQRSASQQSNARPRLVNPHVVQGNTSASKSAPAQLGAASTKRTLPQKAAQWLKAKGGSAKARFRTSDENFKDSAQMSIDQQGHLHAESGVVQYDDDVGTPASTTSCGDDANTAAATTITSRFTRFSGREEEA